MVNVDPMMNESTVSHEYKSNERVRGYKDKSCKSNDKFYDVCWTKMTNLISFGRSSITQCWLHHFK